MSPDRINQLRAYLTWSIRAIAAVFLALAGLEFATRIFHGVSSLYYGGTFFDVAFGYGPRGSTGHLSLGEIIVHLVMALVLFLIAKRLSRWIITIPQNNCPACNYPRPIITPQSENNSDDPPLQPSTYCPECGLQGFSRNSQTGTVSTHHQQATEPDRPRSG